MWWDEDLVCDPSEQNENKAKASIWFESHHRELPFHIESESTSIC